MRNKQQLLSTIASRIEGRLRNTVTFDDLITSLNALSQGEKKQFIKFILKNNDNKILEIFKKSLRDGIRQTAITRAKEILADDSASLAELDEIL